MDIEQLKDACQLQLSELEMVQSMYPGPGEVKIENDNSLLDRQACAAGDGAAPYTVLSRLDYSVAISTDKCTAAQLRVSLPPLYPHVPAEVVLRCPHVAKGSLLAWNADLAKELLEQEPGELVVGVLLSWCREWAHRYCHADQGNCTTDSSNSTTTTNSSSSKKDTFCRMWIYSHHIYSKVKRKDLLSLSGEYDLTGFVLPGKPGVICVEGTRQNTDDWWSLVRSWQWQKILCKKQETGTCPPGDTIARQRRFKDFHELGPADEIRIKSSGFHVDMGDLYRYLKKHSCDYMFKEYFGVEGKDAATS